MNDMTEYNYWPPADKAYLWPYGDEGYEVFTWDDDPMPPEDGRGVREPRRPTPPDDSSSVVLALA